MHVAIAKVTAPAQCEHCRDPLQINVTLLDRQRARRVHDNFKLAVSQGNHAGIMQRRRAEQSGPNQYTVRAMEPQRKPGALRSLASVAASTRVDLRMRLQERDKRAAADTQNQNGG
jgi:hypothetical protein